MPGISRILFLTVLTALAVSNGNRVAAENRTPTPEEFKKLIQQYNESGRIAAPQQVRQTPKSVEQFNRAVTLHTKKDATRQELKEAVMLYQASSDGGIPQASTNLALLYLEGKGVKKDVKMALSLLNAASAKNESQAEIALARLYLNGTDVKKDEKKGEALLNKAAKGGNQNAVKMLAEYKEWKKKNEIAMKQYQDLMKQVQMNQNKPVTPAALPSFQFMPQTPESLPFPVIPGYAHVSNRKPPLPNFLAASPQRPPQPFNILPQGTPVTPPLKIESGERSAAPAEPKISASEQPSK